MRTKENQSIMKFFALLITLLSLVFGILFTKNINAQASVVNSIVFESTNIRHNEQVKVSVGIGGNNTQVKNKQSVEITFNEKNAKFNFPRKPISLLDGNNISLGEVNFIDNKAILVFNEYAESLDGIEGGFSFYAQGCYTGDLNKPGVGSISVDINNKKEEVQVEYYLGGNSTDNIYSKKGVSDSENSSRVDWVFNINAAKKSINYPNEKVSYSIKDKLPETMSWDNEDNNKKAYVVEVSGTGEMAQLHKGWHNLEYAKNKLGIKVDVDGQDLSIEVFEDYDNNGKLISPLDKTNIVIRLSATIKSDVIKDDSIEFVTNTSQVALKSTNNDWKISQTDLSDSAKIYRQKGWGRGTKPGELEILKLVKDSNQPIGNVVFELWRTDNKSIRDNGKVMKLVSDQEGYASVDNLPVGEYQLKEISAPSWLIVDQSIKTFNIKSGDKEGSSIKIYNEKKKTDLKAQKIWHDIDNKELKTKLALERKIESDKDFSIIKDSIQELNKEKQVVNWDNIDLYDDLGNEYIYQVKELDEENGVWIDDKDVTYYVDYQGNQEEGFIIINTKKEPFIDLKPSTFNLEVSKQWVGIDKDDAFEVKVNLIKNGLKTDQSIVLNKDNNWHNSFKDLKIKENINDTLNNEYDIVEEEVEGYQSSIIKESDFEYIVVNTKLEEKDAERLKRDIKVGKIWLDKEDNLMDNPVDSIKVELYKNGEATNSIIELNNENDWSLSFKDLDINDENNHLIEYSIKEVGEEGFIIFNDIYYSVEYSGTMDDGFIVSNQVMQMMEPLDPSGKPKPSEPENEKPSTNDKVDNDKVTNKKDKKKKISQTGYNNNLEYIIAIISISSIAYVLNRKRV